MHQGYRGPVEKPLPPEPLRMRGDPLPLALCAVCTLAEGCSFPSARYVLYKKYDENKSC
jgi:hypothetical protein